MATMRTDRDRRARRASLASWLWLGVAIFALVVGEDIYVAGSLVCSVVWVATAEILKVRD